MLSRILSSSILFLVCVLMSACATKTPAPVTDRRVNAASPQAPSTPMNSAPMPAPANSPTGAVSKPIDLGKTHTIQKGETLYSLALQNNIDHRELAMWNNIDNPNVIKVGDIIRLTAPSAPLNAATAPSTTQSTSTAAVVTPLVLGGQPSAASERGPTNSASLKTAPQGGKLVYSDQTLARLNNDAAVASAAINPPTTANPANITQPNVPAVPPVLATDPSAVVVPSTSTTPTAAAKDIIEWAWPVKGKVTTSFTELNKGIDIAGARGTAVNAAAAGTVLHTGAGIRGYGRLVIIKHSTGWVSAYAHNDKIIVTEGQEVKRGQKIAEMGNSDADQVKLHFEIRRQGKPIDPVTLLPKQ